MAKISIYLTMLGAAPAFGCPLCHTTTAQEVRAGLWATALNSSVVLSLVLPFLALASLIALLNHPFFDRHL